VLRRFQWNRAWLSAPGRKFGGVFTVGQTFLSAGPADFPVRVVATGKSPPPADRNVCPTCPYLCPNALRQRIRKAGTFAPGLEMKRCGLTLTAIRPKCAPEPDHILTISSPHPHQMFILRRPRWPRNKRACFTTTPNESGKYLSHKHVRHLLTTPFPACPSAFRGRPGVGSPGRHGDTGEPQFRSDLV
jgi:hypothetical protein